MVTTARHKQTRKPRPAVPVECKRAYIGRDLSGLNFVAKRFEDGEVICTTASKSDAVTVARLKGFTFD
jgi:hypothetical protein